MLEISFKYLNDFKAAFEGLSLYGYNSTVINPSNSISLIESRIFLNL